MTTLYTATGSLASFVKIIKKLKRPYYTRSSAEGGKGAVPPWKFFRQALDRKAIFVWIVEKKSEAGMKKIILSLFATVYLAI